MAQNRTRPLIYLLFFLSGAAALVYEIVWVRSLTLVFGGSHQAVAAGLSIFMGGLALGALLAGTRTDRLARPLALYAVLEFGIAVCALAFTHLMTIYPSLYIAVAGGSNRSMLYLTAVRCAFATAALIVPTTLMGATLPVLTRFVASSVEGVRRPLSFLYGLNTLGAVLGASLAGFVMLRLYAVSTTIYVAVATNVLVGVLALAIERRRAVVERARPTDRGRPTEPGTAVDPFPAHLVLWGIAISGFCALGYEVLWTRVLTVAVGASVYGFTLVLIAFLVGIALGSSACGLLIRSQAGPMVRRTVTAFGVVQVTIGIAALATTVFLRDVPVNAIRLHRLLSGSTAASFTAQTWSSFALAVLYMLVPAAFMGAAFPLAGDVQARYRDAVGRGVGDVLAWNTVGAILGSAVSGFALVHWFGIERSLELLSVLNIGIGIVVLLGVRRSRWPAFAAAAATMASLALVAVSPAAARFWDTKYLAIFRSNQPEAFETPAMVREAVENTDVLYYAEGLESIVSVIRVKGGEPAFVTNGRVEASAHLQAQQCQLTLGHLPMLLARDPRRVVVVGLGTGMTLGATSVHPSVEQTTVVEIEPKVLGVARSFAEYNHDVLRSPKLRTIINDGRNFLLTTSETFDVITADPIHPWFRGAGYLYTSEYFELAARHLNRGGVIAQWLPIYELSPDDLRSIVRTFRQHFPHTLLWLTHYDAEILGSADPFVIDRSELARRLAVPAVAADLRRVMMGSPEDLLSYFVMGSDGMARFSRTGVLNTDDRLYLEFSAPLSIASPSVMEANVVALSSSRESIDRYLTLPNSVGERDEVRRWSALQREAGAIGDRALALYLGGKTDPPEFRDALGILAQRYAWYSPGRFLRSEYRTMLALAPRPLKVETFPVTDEGGRVGTIEIAAVLVPISKTRAAVAFVNSAARVIYGQRYVDDYDSSDAVGRLLADVMTAARDAYRKDAEIAKAHGNVPPAATQVAANIRVAISQSVNAPEARR